MYEMHGTFPQKETTAGGDSFGANKRTSLTLASQFPEAGA